MVSRFDTPSPDGLTSIPRTIAVDWSGRASGASRRIWVAEVADAELIFLENGRSRTEIAQLVVDRAAGNNQLVAGFDFAFSFPAWFLEDRGFRSVRELWAAADLHGEEWLEACMPTPQGCPRVIEIYPRALTGAVRKSSQKAREEYLSARNLISAPGTRTRAASTEDAFEAAVSALLMWDHRTELAGLRACPGFHVPPDRPGSPAASRRLGRQASASAADHHRHPPEGPPGRQSHLSTSYALVPRLPSR